jgi:hypothetical protein
LFAPTVESAFVMAHSRQNRNPCLNLIQPETADVAEFGLGEILSSGTDLTIVLHNAHAYSAAKR